MNRKKLLKKAGLTLATIAIVIAGAAAFSAFEAHVINVTARIENALSVPTDAIDFGTVFPQEQLDREFTVALSQSFLDEPRVDDIEYVIRQKPKCAWTTDDGEVLFDLPTHTGHVVPAENELGYEIVCPDPSEEDQAAGQAAGADYGVLPLLCPYLSKHIGPEDEGEEAVELDAFHNPWTVDDETIDWNEAAGFLSKLAEDEEDTWILDLKVPCFGDHCAQDWESFVLGINPDAAPADQWIQPFENEHKIFGCDIWVEVGEVSETPPTSQDGTLTVTKIIVGQTASTSSDFEFTIDGGTAVPFEGDGSNDVVVSAGAHVVAEVPAPGFTTTIGGDCDASGNVNVPAAGSAECTITNTVEGPGTGTITVIKVIINNNGGTATTSDFLLDVSGEPVESGVPEEFAPGDYSVDESGVLGYSASFSGDCDSAGDITLGAGEDLTCTITNDDIAPTITLFKSIADGDATTTDFTLLLDDASVPHNSSTSVEANVAHSINESDPSGLGYEFTSLSGTSAFGVACPASLGGTITLGPGDSVICTITNSLID